METIYQRIARILEVKHGVNIKRFCYYLNKRGKTDFISWYYLDCNSCEIRKEIERANKVLNCNMDEALQELCTKLEQDEYRQFVEALSRAYQHERIMFLQPVS